MTNPDFQEYEGPTAAEAAEVFTEAKSGFDVRSLDPRKLDLNALREFDWRSLDPRELAGKVDLSKVDLSKVDLSKVELPKVDFAKVSQDATALVSTATTKAAETATELRRGVESGVKIVRELVGR